MDLVGWKSVANTSAEGPLSVFAMSVDAVEVLTGMDSFPILPDSLEETVEAVADLSHWGVGEGVVPTTIESTPWGLIKRQ